MTDVRSFNPLGLAVLLMMTSPALAARKTSADHLEYPPADAQRITMRSLPLAKRWLGELPEEVTAGKIYSLKDTTDPVAKWRDELGKHKIDLSEFDWITSGLSGSQVTLIALENGRVAKLAFFFPRLTQPLADSMLAPLKRIDRHAEFNKTWARATVDGVRVVAVLTGHHEWTMVPEHHHIIGKKSTPVEKPKKESFPSMIVMGVDNIDWYLAYNKHHISESVAVGLAHGRLADGMTLTEALMAKRELRAFRGGDTIEWGERAPEGPNWIATHAVYDPNLPGIPSYLTHPAASAVLHDGKLAEIRQ